MDYILDDFVDRSPQLDFMWQIARQEVESRILIIEGNDGIGKSYLLKEFLAECQEEGIESVRVDFVEKDWDPGYMYIIKEILNQLGTQSFAPLEHMIRETIQQSARDHVQADARDIQSKRGTEQSPPVPKPAPIPKESENPPLNASGVTPVRSGGVNITGGQNIFRDVAGRDIITLIQIIQREDPFVQAWASARIAEALKNCLIEITSKRSIVFILDHWQKVDKDTRRWLERSLIKWAADDILPKASIVLAVESSSELNPRKRIKRDILPELDEESVRIYLVKKCGLSDKEVPEIFRVTGGIPLMLTMAVARRKRFKPRG